MKFTTYDEYNDSPEIRLTVLIEIEVIGGLTDIMLYALLVEKMIGVTGHWAMEVWPRMVIVNYLILKCYLDLDNVGK